VIVQKKGAPWYLLEVASPFADKERIDWQIPAWKRHPKWSKHVKTHRVHCFQQPNSNLFIATTRVFLPKRPATSGSPWFTSSADFKKSMITCNNYHGLQVFSSCKQNDVTQDKGKIIHL